MKLIVTDTNVFFDMMSIEVLPDFFGLDYEICTTDFVVNEIERVDQAAQIQNFIRSKQLTVYKLTSNEIDEVVQLKTKRNLRRITDKSVLWKALQLKCRLVTGDKNLRSEAEDQGLEVSGSIWVVKMLVETNIVSPVKGVELLAKLKLVNDSLPKDEIEKLIRKLS
ncbi:MAG: PIN domain-containing protein [Bacteroidia bacterium]